ncbi:MAG TPA: copper resistance protein NlpE [Sphingobacteriaceae bacterium]|nr:copper resistance protein NlpE [Sphingobacteriaceae bacterium]
MGKVYFLVTLLFIGLGFSSCSSKVTRGGSSSEFGGKEEFRPRGPLFWIEPSGQYKGAIPCSDCAGIEVTLDFKKDYTVEKTMRYIKKGGQTKKLKGTWVVQAGNIVQISYANTPKEFYKAQAGAHLIALNDKQEIDKERVGQFNVFNKY